MQSDAPRPQGLLARLLEPEAQIPEERRRFSNPALKALILPVLIEQFLALLVGIVDTLMISYAGEAAVSSVSLVDQLNNVFIMAFTALASGGAVVASQYVGREDKENGDMAASQLVMAISAISILLGLVVLLFGRQIFGLLFGRVEQEVLDTGMVYMRITAFSFPFLALYNGCAGLFRSMGRTKILMQVSIAMNGINVAGNAIGVFALRAGVAGVAWPTLISRAFAAVAMVMLTMNPENPISLRLSMVFSCRWSMITRIFRIAVPNGIESGLFQLSKVALSSIVATFGTVQIAANGVAQSFWSMSALFCIAMGPVFITVVGQYMGAGDVEGADYYMKKLLRITFAGAAVWNLTILLATPLALQVYSLSGEAKHLVILLVFIHNSLNAVFGPVAFAFANGLRAAGDVKFTMYAAIFATVVCRVSLSFLFGLALQMGAVGVALAMVCDWVIKAILVIWRYKGGKWRTMRVI